MKNLHNEEYMCDECGNTTPIPNDNCPVCGGKMSPLHEDDSKKKNFEDDDLENDDFSDLHDGIGEDTGEESLETLRAEEEDESEEDYHNSFNDTDNVE